MTEATLMVDSLGRNRLYTGNMVPVRQIFHLMSMDPGTDLLNPEKGIGIANYRYSYTDESLLIQLERTIREQITKYTPYTVNQIICKDIPNTKGDHILHVFIAIEESPDVIGVSTDGEKVELAMMQL